MILAVASYVFALASIDFGAGQTLKMCSNSL